MATPTSEKIDIPLMVARLAPGSEYHWLGNGWGTYADIGEWRTPDIAKPSEQAIYAEWDAYLVEKQTNDAVYRQVFEAAKSAAGISVTDLTPVQYQALTTLLLWQMGILNPDGTVRPFKSDKCINVLHKT